MTAEANVGLGYTMRLPEPLAIGVGPLVVINVKGRERHGLYGAMAAVLDVYKLNNLQGAGYSSEWFGLSWGLRATAGYSLGSRAGSRG